MSHEPHIPENQSEGGKGHPEGEEAHQRETPPPAASAGPMPGERVAKGLDSEPAGLTRRGVLHVAWTVPVILTVKPPLTPRDVFAQSAPHGDEHDDIAHSDVPQHDDIVHIDDPHLDGAHDDTHSDNTHIDHDDIHADTHDDTHDDNTHIDEPHLDGAHDDTHDDSGTHIDHDDIHADSFLDTHFDTHSDIHFDSHIDTGEHIDVHGDLLPPPGGI